MNIIAVGMGGFLGAMLRFFLLEWPLLPDNFPLGTVIENLIGCLLLGWFLTLTLERWKMSPRIRLMIGTGAIGSFTTFSTFSLETLLLLQNQQFTFVLVNIFLTIIGGIILAAVGIKLARWMSGERERVV